MEALIGFDEALARLVALASPIGVETISLLEAEDRVLARAVTAAIDSPRADASAMDGYAVREADLETSPIRLEVVGRSFPGRAFSAELQPGQCVRIFTGAPVPAGADRVVIQEMVECIGDIASIDKAPGPARHLRQRAGDFAMGDCLLSPGRLLDAAALMGIAAGDRSEVEVFKKPIVSLLITGDELVAPGQAADRRFSVPDSVSPGISALARRWGAHVAGVQRLQDDLPAMRAAAADAAAKSDVVIVTGGASVGEHDFAKAMFETLGLDLIFSKVAIKPGKPVWLGRVKDSLVLGLPGNPGSAFVTARLFLAPLLAGLCGRGSDAALRWRTARLAEPMDACGARETFHRGRAEIDRVQILHNQDSSAQHPLALANVLLRQRAFAPAHAAGEAVEILDF